MIAQHLTVSQLVGQIKNTLEGQFKNVSLIGEVTNLSSSGAGHYYFTLSDRDASISVALFKGDALRNPYIKKLRDGDKIICLGSISVYAKRGTFQVLAKNIAPAGTGDLKEQLELLKKKLSAEGLFDVSVKKPIPAFPKRVAVITAKGGAALQDFLNIYERRSLWMDIVLLPALVQGRDAPASLRSCLERAIKYSLENPESAFDVIVLTRGGGSLEDLWAFNDEGLAWDIYNSPIPIISAVGHQVDTSISDFCADLSTETPSAAAELLTAEQVKIHQRLDYATKSLKTSLENSRKDILQKNKYLSPKHLLNLMRSQLEREQRRLDACQLIGQQRTLLNLPEKEQRLDDALREMSIKMKDRFKDLKNRTTLAFEKMTLLDPKHALKRGYSYAQTIDHQLVKDQKTFDKLKEGSELILTFKDGQGQVRKSK